MPKFKINFTEKNLGSVVVHAVNKDEAMLKWEAAVFEGEADFANTNLQFQTIERDI